MFFGGSTSLSGNLHFCKFLLPFSVCPLLSYLVSVGLSESRLVLVGPVPVSVGLLLAFPGPSRPPLEEDRKKENVTKSYTFRNENVTCHAGGNLRQNSSEGESSVPLGLDELGTGSSQDRNAGNWT